MRGTSGLGGDEQMIRADEGIDRHEEGKKEGSFNSLLAAQLSELMENCIVSQTLGNYRLLHKVLLQKTIYNTDFRSATVKLHQIMYLILVHKRTKRPPHSKAEGRDRG